MFHIEPKDMHVHLRVAPAWPARPPQAIIVQPPVTMPAVAALPPEPAVAPIALDLVAVAPGTEAPAAASPAAL